MRMTRKHTDAQIVEAFATADHLLMHQYYEACRSTVRRATSRYQGITDYERDELFQDSFIVLWEKIETRAIFTDRGHVFVRTRAGIAPLPDLTAYFIRIVRNKYLELMRRSSRTAALSDTLIADIEAHNLNEPLWWDSDPDVMKERLMSEALRSLPRGCIDLLTKFYYDRMTLDQILAERPDGSSYDGLKTRKSKCLASLRRRMAKALADAGLSI